MLDGPLFDRPDDPGDPALRRRQGWIVAIVALPLAYATTCLLAAGSLFALQTVVGSSASELTVLTVFGVAFGTVGQAVLLGAVAWFWTWIRPLMLVVAEVVFLGILPIWGMLINAGLPDCSQTCVDPYEALTSPGAYAVYALYGVTLIAYSLGRTGLRSDAEEIGIVALVLVGDVVALMLALQFLPALPAGLMFGVVGLPLWAPVAVVFAYSGFLYDRLPRLSERAGRFGVWVGLPAGMVTALTTLRIYTQTCGWTLSQLTPPPADCHYLCTVAAQGHPWLVRPIRLGRRRGRVIVVNRQLAAANAFEDLLHERWPRFGRFCRDVYDAVGLPVSHLIRWPWLADAVFLAMLPAQALFELTLWWFDGPARFARMNRMYR